MYRQGRIAPAFKDTYDKLLNIRNKLEKLTLTQAWSLRETDLWDFQRQLDRVDEARVDGNFVDALGRSSEIYEQRVIPFKLRYGYWSNMHYRHCSTCCERTMRSYISSY